MVLDLYKQGCFIFAVLHYYHLQDTVFMVSNNSAVRRILLCSLFPLFVVFLVQRFHFPIRELITKEAGMSKISNSEIILY
jgi:hypothetical protein